MLYGPNMGNRKRHDRPVVLGYRRVSTAEQEDSGLGLAGQAASLTAEAERRGWDLEIITEPAMSGGIADRPVLNAALERLREGSADVLAVAKLDRLSRSVSHGAGLLEQAQREGWIIVALDMGVDTGSPSGELMSNMLLTMARFEKRLIGQRTRDALAQKRAAGIVLGRPTGLTPEVVARIAAERAAGVSLGRIAAGLNESQVPTAHGGIKWWPSTVAYALQTAVSIPPPHHSPRA